jgi:Condensation domain
MDFSIRPKTSQKSLLFPLFARYKEPGGRNVVIDTADQNTTRLEIQPEDTSHSSPSTAPLSFQQKHFWSASQKDPDMRLNVSTALRLSGGLNEEILRISLEQLVERHGALRTRITLIGGIPRQLIDPPGPYRLEERSISCSPEDVEQIGMMVDEFLRAPLNLVEGPILKSRLIRLSQEESILLINIHHIVIDGFSVGILFRELWQRYTAMSHQGSLESIEPCAQYSDYARWQGETHGAWLQEHAGYWRERLASSEPLRFPADPYIERCGPPHDKPELLLLPFQFDEALTAGIYAAARREGTMPAMIVLTAYAALLSTWCNQRRFLVHMHVAGRDIPEYIGTIGFFADVLFLRIEIRSGQTFRDLLADVTREVCEAYEHRGHWRLATEESLGDLESATRTGFNWTPGSEEEIAGCPSPAMAAQLADELAIEQFRYRSPHQFPRLDPSSRFGAGLIWMYPGTVISGTLGYNTRFFSPAGAERLLTNLRVAVGLFSADSDLLVSSALRHLALASD